MIGAETPSHTGDRATIDELEGIHGFLMDCVRLHPLIRSEDYCAVDMLGQQTHEFRSAEERRLFEGDWGDEEEEAGLVPTIDERFFEWIERERDRLAQM